ncbi:MAG: class I SAM-dependent methyltransferase [Candidatus Rokubacteria bacterium]|nr:class I SAM-dependent methyltransferase [Candidatus Rokubacteria bacterium]
MATGLHVDVRRFFDARVGEWAASYADLEPGSPSAQMLVSRLRLAVELVAADVPPGSKVVDLGCGTGETAARLERLGYEVWGLDLVEGMIGYARGRCASGRFQVGDLTRMPFRDDTFDAVVCLGVVEYLDGDDRALREIRRVLRPGACAVISTPNAVCPLFHADRVLVGLLALLRPLAHVVRYRLRGKQGPARQAPRGIVSRKYRRGRWLRLVRSAGLEPEEWVCHGWGWHRSWPLDFAGRLLFRAGRSGRRLLERWPGLTVLRRIDDALVHSRALNWLAAEQIVRVRAVEEPGRRA